MRAGEIVGLAGLVGSGRSELAQTLFGITPADSGEIRSTGAPVVVRSPAEARSLGIAYVPEDRGTQGLVRPMSVLQNFSLAVCRGFAVSASSTAPPRRRLAARAVKQFDVRTSSLEEDRGQGFRAATSKRSCSANGSPTNPGC